MQKKDSIRELLGITQDDLAIILKIGRSQLAMYEIGKRDIPTAAKIKLAEMLTYMNETSTLSVADEPYIKIQDALREKVIAALIEKNKYQQLLIEKKIIALEKKYIANLKAMKLYFFLETQSAKNEEELFIKSIATKALKEIKKNGLPMLIQHQIKKEMLQNEEQLLKNYINKI